MKGTVTRPIIAVIDDDAAVRAALGRLLMSMGLSVDTYASAEEFLSHADPNEFDCLLLDVQLRGMSGLETKFASLDEPDPLTDRETEILRLMAGGYSNKEIANSLDVAEGTVKNHVSNILSKLGVRDRTRAVLKALELGLI